MKLLNLKLTSLISLLILMLMSGVLSASDCNKHPRVGCPDTIYQDNRDTFPLASVIPDLLPGKGHSRIDGALANYSGNNAGAITFMHNWDSKGTIWEGHSDSVSLGISAATGEGDGNNWLFRVQGGVEF